MVGFVAVVSGANKGIGLEIVRLLAAAKSAAADAAIFLGSRDRERGLAAVEKLRCPNVRLLSLDIDSPSSISDAVGFIAREFGRLDVLVCNASIAAKGTDFNHQIAAKTLGTNFFGTCRLVQEALPLMRSSGPGARVVFVSSRSGDIAKITTTGLRNKILSASSVEQLKDLGEDFISSVADGTYADKGWPQNTYSVSKILTTCLANVYSSNPENTGMRFYACCPGWVRTDMGGPSARLSPAQGADTPAWLALSDDEAVIHSSGSFFAERRKLNFEHSFAPIRT